MASVKHKSFQNKVEKSCQSCSFIGMEKKVNNPHRDLLGRFCSPKAAAHARWVEGMRDKFDRGGYGRWYCSHCSGEGYFDSPTDSIHLADLVPCEECEGYGTWVER